MTVDVKTISASVRIRAAVVAEGLQLYEKGTLTPRATNDLLASLEVNMDRLRDEWAVFLRSHYGQEF